MSRARGKRLSPSDYEKAALAYLRGLPLEHFMEAIPQATQREITLASLALVRARQPEVQVFNELLVQYMHRGQLRQVVPDNMVVLGDQPPQSKSSFNVELNPDPPFWVFEYVSETNPRKDYEDSFRKYEKELKVPYYLLFYPEKQDLRLYRRKGRQYAPVTANARGRLALPKLKLEVGLLEGWVRFWYRGELLPLPAELQSQLEQARHEAEQQRRRADAAEQELARLRAQLAELSRGAGEQ